MKIKELKVLLKDAILELKFKYEEAKQGNSTVSVFSNLDQYRNGISILENSGLFKKEIDQIRSTPIF